MEKGSEKPINMNINSDVWRKVGIMAADLEMTKKKIVEVALLSYWAEFKNAK